jgi:hypothetical protein
MPEQPSTLAARIRAKYPGVYDDIADIELEEKVSTKYPGVYDDVPRTQATLTRERAPQPAGQLERGNIDLRARPTVKNPDGSISTVRSLGVNIDGHEVLIPTVSDDGRVVSDDEAIDLYRRTGRHLGKFDTPQNATAYAEQLHNAQAQQYGGGPGHHPDIARALARDQVSPFSAMLGESGETFGRWSNDNLPALASTGAALATGGASIPVAMGAAALAGGAGAAGRETLRRLTGEGKPLTGEQLGLDMLEEGATSGALAGVRAPIAAGRVVGPAIARNARGITNAARTLSGSGFAGSVASGNVPAMLTSGAAAIATHPSVIRGVGNLATRVGSSPMLNAAAQRLGLGANVARAGADAFRKALLDALAEEQPASAVP